MHPRLPILAARIVPSDMAALEGQRVYAFAGIGRPEKFFETLADAGAEVVGSRAFDDHHVFAMNDLMSLEAEAKHLNARLVTTEKDHVRLDALAQRRISALPVELAFDNLSAINALIEPLLTGV
jgi:tetraacyldisaccharide 4'-kinase